VEDRTGIERFVWFPTAEGEKIGQGEEWFLVGGGCPQSGKSRTAWAKREKKEIGGVGGVLENTMHYPVMGREKKVGSQITAKD